MLVRMSVRTYVCEPCAVSQKTLSDTLLKGLEILGGDPKWLQAGRQVNPARGGPGLVVWAEPPGLLEAIWPG